MPFLIPSFNDKKEDPGSAWSTLTTASRFVCDSQWSKTVLVSSRSKFHIPTRRVQQVPGALDCLFSCGSSWNFLFVWMFLWEAECQIIWRCTLWIERTELTVLFWWKFVGFLICVDELWEAECELIWRYLSMYFLDWKNWVACQNSVLRNNLRSWNLIVRECGRLLKWFYNGQSSKCRWWCESVSVTYWASWSSMDGWEMLNLWSMTT